MVKSRPLDLHQEHQDHATRSCEERVLLDLIRPIVNRRFRFLDGTLNPDRCNFSDERP